MKSDRIYIALGANLPVGDRTPAQTLADALEALEAAGVAVAARSSLWTSPSWPDPSKPPYTNAVVEVRTNLDARALLDLLHKIEAGFGRTRIVRWESRPLDLDLIDCRGEVKRDPDGLEIPHPRMRSRAFVLLPLQEIAPDWRHPETGAEISDLVAALDPADIAATRKLHNPSSQARETLAFTGRDS